MGVSAVLKDLFSAISQHGPTALAADCNSTEPRWVMRAGTRTLEAFIALETADGHARGVLRLGHDASAPTDTMRA